ncbi:MAG: hypothetical protein ABI678_15910, partial [Kofleriaceae bacterium]
LVGRHVYTFGALLRRWLRKHRAAVTVATAMLVVSGVALGLAFRTAIRSRDRAEAEEWATRRTQAAQIVEHAHTMLPIDPGEALATLATLPPDAGADAYAAAWPLAVAAASAPRSHALFRSPGAAYSWLGYGGDGVLVGVRPVDDKVYATDRFADGIVVTESATLRADHIKNLAASRARVHLGTLCDEVDLASGARAPCASTPTVTLDTAHHQIVTLEPHGVRHVHPIAANLGGYGRDVEATIVIAPDGRSFVLGINTGQRVTIMSDIAMEHLTILPSPFVAAVYTQPDLATVVMENAINVVEPHDPVNVRQGGSLRDRATIAIVSADKKRMAVAIGRGVELYDTSTVLALAKAPVPHDITALALSPDGTSVTIALADRSVRVLSQTSSERGSDWFEGLVVDGDRATYSLTGPRQEVDQLAPGEVTRSAYLVRPMPEMMVLIAHTNGASSPLAVAGDAAAGVIENRVLRFDLTRGSAAVITAPRVPDQLALSPDAKILIGRAGPDLLVWRDRDVETLSGAFGAFLGDHTLVVARGTTLTIGDRAEALDCTASALAVRGPRIAVGCTNGQVRVVGERRLASVLAPSPVVTLAISPTGAIAAVGADPAIQVWTDSVIPIVLRGPNVGTTFLQWVNHGEILTSATPVETWLWAPRHGIGAPLTEVHRRMLGDDFALELVEPPRWELLPSRTPLGFHAWLASQSR